MADPIRHIDSLESRRLFADAFSVSVNFQPMTAQRAPGLLVDYGSTYGVRRGGLSYGWDTDASANAVDRNATPIQKNDTFIAMQQGGDHTWEIGVESGVYRVYVVAGDPAVFNDRMAITAENTLVVSGVTRSARRYLEGSADVQVTDGRLTIASASWAVNNKLAYLAVTRIGDIPIDNPDDPIPPPPVPETPIKYNLSWSTTTSLPAAKAEAFSAVVGNTLYAFGGYFDATFLATTSSYKFDAGTKKWTAIRSLPLSVAQAAATSDSRYVYFAGGYVTSGGKQTFATTAAYKYDTQTDTYTALPSLPVARGPGAMARINNTLIFMGGGDSKRADVATVWSLDLGNTAAGWQTRASMPAARNRFGTAVVDGNIYVIGGQTGNDSLAVYQTNNWVYNIATNAWSTLASMPTARSHIAASTIVENGRILVLGGEGAGRKALSTVQSYDPATNTWRSMTSLPGTRFSGVAGLIDGKLIFGGGYNGAFSKTTWLGTLSG